MASISTCSSTIQPFSDCFCRCIDRSTSRFSLYDLNHIRIANRFESSASRSRSLTNFRRRDNSKRPFSLRIVCSRDSKAAAVTWKSWDKLVLKSESPVLIEFYAGWCGPCQMVHRVIDEIAAEYSGRLRCFVLDTDKNLQVAEQYDVKAVPVILLFKNGEKEVSIVGTMPKEFYVSAIEKVLAS